MNRKTQKQPYTERELEKNVPESTHDNFGGQRKEDSSVPEQVKRDATETSERLKHEIEENDSGS